MTKHIKGMRHANQKKGRIAKHREWTAPLRGLPSFMVIGVEKGGTSSLAMYLNHHPRIAKPYAKESRFFLQHFHKGMGFYPANFPLAWQLVLRNQITYDASPMYMFYDEVKHRIKATGIDFKFVVLLREPGARAYSHFRMALRNGVLPAGTTFEELVDREIRNWDPQRQFPYQGFFRRREQGELTYLARSYYAKQLKDWFEIFPRDKFMIKQTEALDRNPAPIMHDIYKFLELDPAAVHPDKFEVKYHAYKYPDMSESVQNKLQKFFKPLNQELFDLLGEEWCW